MLLDSGIIARLVKLVMRIQSFFLASFLGLSVPFFAGCSTSSNTGGTTTTPPAAAPTVSSISPTSVSAGAGATTLTVTGTGFTGTTAIQVGGSIDVTTFVSSTQVTAAVTAAQIASGGTLTVIAVDSTGTSGAGPAVNLTVNNPSPAITSLAPSTFTTGSPATTLVLTGSGFVPTTTVQVGGNARAASFITSTQMNVTLTAADLGSAANVSVIATNPTPGGGTSSAASFAVNNPAPSITGLLPTTVVSGALTATNVTVNGTNFLSTSVVQVAGAARTTTYVSPTQLTFALTVADQASTAKLAVTVLNPTPGGGTSGAATLTIAAPTPTPVLTSVSPASLLVGSGNSSVGVFGTALQSNCTVLWNGTALTTGYSVFSGLYLIGSVPASLLTTAGTATVTASCPTAPAVSNGLTVSIVNPPAPTLVYISPGAGPINTATAITLSGTGFTTASTVSFNGAVIPSTYVNSTSITVALPAANVTLPGNNTFTVTTPAPGGGTTVPLIYTAFIGIVNNSMVYNPVNGLMYVSVPSYVGAPYGNSVVSVDPETGALGTPIPVGSEPNKLAVTADGKYLWVGLDGASAVRKVDLTTGTAGLQFGLSGNAGIYATPGTAVALAALPGATDSVVVSSSGGYSTPALAIYDAGVLRGAILNNYTLPTASALNVDGSRSEIYAGGSGYVTYTYNASGLTKLAQSATTASFASYYFDEMQLANGRVYSDAGGVYDAESGSLLGTFYTSGTTVAGGPTAVDTTLGRAFILDGGAGTYAYNQIQAFNTSDFNATSASTIPVNVVYNTGGPFSSASAYPSRLTRWGTNGLAFRTSAGIFSLRSNLVKDLSSTSADLGVSVTATGAATTGSTSTYTATITNSGPSAATDVALTAVVPSSGALQTITASTGTCSSSNGVSCHLGSIASGASVTVTVTVQQLVAGTATLTAQVTGAETDPVASNNRATASVTVTGATFTLAPTLQSITPAAVQTGSPDTIVTVVGTGFTSGSTVMLNGTALSTSFTNGTKLTATVPAAQLANLGWSAITVNTPAPGGGVSNAAPLTVFSVITLGLNHILYDPFTRNLMGSVGSGSSTVVGNSIVAITPDTATVGTAVPIGSQPTNMALTSDGQVLYTILSGSQSVARFNMLTQQADYTYAVGTVASAVGGVALRGIAAQPGTENTIALDLASFSGNAIFDFNPTAKTAAIRGQASGPYSGSCIQFLDAADLLGFDTDTSGSTLDHYSVTAAGFTYYNYQQYTTSTLNHFGCFKVNNGLAYSVSGGVANPVTVPATQLGVFGIPSGYGYAGQGNVAPDSSLQRTFFAVYSNANGSYSSYVDSIEAFDNNTYVASSLLPIPFSTIEGTNSSFSVPDLVRWGQDGLAALTSTGHLYLLRGPMVAPRLLGTNTAATLASSSASTVTHGAGNTVLTLTGTNFVPGVAVTWNGSYRTTTIVDAAHVTVAIPASDLASAGSGSLVAKNPGAAASGALTVTVQ
jgi:hypothetical protein